MIDHKKTVRKRKCIITFARAWHALAATRCLGLRGIEVITGDTSNLAAASFSRHSKDHFSYPDPDKDPEGFLDKLEKVARKHQAPDTDLVLMPLHSACTYAIISAHKRFDGLAKLALPNKEQFELAGDKARLSLFCQEHNFRMPPTLVIDQVEQFRELASRFAYPAFLKLPTSAASIGMVEVKSAEEAVHYFEKLVRDYDLKAGEYPVLQEKVDGEDYCSTFLFDHGEPRAAMTYRNILTYPSNGGMGAVRETIDAPEMEAVGNALLRRLNWHGVAQIDFRWDGSSSPWVIEINPRFWGSLAQSIESGWEYPCLLYELAVAGRINAVTPTRRYVRTKNRCLTTLLAIQEFMEAEGAVFDPRGRLRAVKKVFGEGRTAIDEVFRWDDPLPMLGLLYPLTVLMKHGKITPELLISKAKIAKRK